MSDPTDQIKEAIFAGKKIEAIQLYRDQTNLGLVEAKSAVEKLENELRASSPDRFLKPQSKFNTLALLSAVSLFCGVVSLFARNNIQIAIVFIFLSLVTTNVTLEIRALREEIRRLRDKA